MGGSRSEADRNRKKGFLIFGGVMVGLVTISPFLPKPRLRLGVAGMLESLGQSDP